MSFPYNINGDVISIYYYPFKFQVDFLIIPPSQMAYAQNYFAWGCAGNLIGRLSKQLGFKHGHKGLHLVQRSGSHVLAQIKLSDDYYKIIEILELNLDKYKSGFNSEEDLFEWFSQSPYFNPEFFKFENLPNKDRVRDKKRKDYNHFISWCESKSFQPTKYLIENKLSFVLSFFPEYSEIVQQNVRDLERRQLIKDKFNGNIIMGLTSLKGARLGYFMHDFSSKYGDDFILNSSSYWINLFIVAEYMNGYVKR